jgi:leader peptidase (prepilin peptidase)/N-methyltransferase
MNIFVAAGLALGGFALGLLLNPLITRMATDPKAANPLAPVRYALLGGPAWLGLVVAGLMSLMTVMIYRYYGLSFRALYWLAVSIVLIITGAVDWKVRLIDVFVLLGATLLALIAAPLIGMELKLALLGAVIAGIVFIFFFIVARLIYPGDGVPFGLGDVYLAIFMGAALGLQHFGSALFYGVIMGGVAAIGVLAIRQMGSNTEPYLSYGTYLCLGTLLYIILWSPL